MNGESIHQLNVPYVPSEDLEEYQQSADSGLVETFEAQLPESFANEDVALERARRRLPDGVQFVGVPEIVGEIHEYDTGDVRF